MYFKDLITDTIEMFMSIAKGKNFYKCPHCKKGRLKKEDIAPYLCEIMASKFAASAISCLIGEAGTAIPARDYHYKCPKCKSNFIMGDGWFI